MKKVEKQNNTNLMYFWDAKPMLNVSFFNNLHQVFNIMRIVHKMMDACRDNMSKENACNKKDTNVHVAFLISKH